MSTPAGYFEALYRADPDPWNFAGSAYERAKYARTLAALDGRPRPLRALELGCSIGVLTEGLADRCVQVVACDAAPTAVALARERLRTRANVEVLCATLPDELPGGRWDLVVASEILYYLDSATCARTLERVEEALVRGGVLLAVHWTHPTRTHPQQGDEVHEMLDVRPALERIHSETHPDYRLDLLRRR